MCSPARTTLLTGYFPAQHGETTNLAAQGYVRTPAQERQFRRLRRRLARVRRRRLQPL